MPLYIKGSRSLTSNNYTRDSPQKWKTGKRATRMKSVEGSLFRLIFLKKCLGTYSFQTHRCTKVIKHSACAMTIINPFWANPQSCNPTYSYGKWMKITYLKGDFPWQTVELPEVLPEKLRLAPEIIALPKPKVQCSDPKVKGHRDHLKKSTGV